MSKRIYIEIEGFETPVFINVDVEGYEDPIDGFERFGLFEKPLSMKVRIDKRELKVRSEPRK